MNTVDLKDEIKSKYGEAARRVASGSAGSCCAPTLLWRRREVCIDRRRYVRPLRASPEI